MTCCPVKLHCLNTRIAYRVPPQLVRICVYVRNISTRCHEFLLQKQKGISAMPCSQCLQGIAASLCWTNSRRVLGRERRLYGSSPLVFFHSIHKGHDILPWDVRFDYVSRRDEKSSPSPTVSIILFTSCLTSSGVPNGRVVWVPIVPQKANSLP